MVVLKGWKKKLQEVRRPWKAYVDAQKSRSELPGLPFHDSITGSYGQDQIFRS